MKIAITSEGQSTDAAIDPRFGRCKYFLIMDTNTGKFEAVENSNAQNSGGAGIQAGQLVVSKGVEAVLTGNMGPNAFQVVQSAGIKVITGVSGKISEVLERYKSGKLEATQNPSVGSKSGIAKA
jgi:predicted Fe-Mo cluster-binding NifX family protein